MPTQQRVQQCKHLCQYTWSTSIFFHLASFKLNKSQAVTGSITWTLKQKVAQILCSTQWQLEPSSNEFWQKKIVLWHCAGAVLKHLCQASADWGYWLMTLHIVLLPSPALLEILRTCRASTLIVHDFGSRYTQEASKPWLRAGQTTF